MEYAEYDLVESVDLLPLFNEGTDVDLPSLWQLRVFEAVARLGSMSRAAQEVLRSQPAVTASILRLEKSLDISLFERAATGTYLTPAGSVMFGGSREILADAERAVAAAGGHSNASSRAIASGISKAQMRAIIAVNDAYTFQGAAADLQTSSASLHRLARQLERQIGATLYCRTASGMVATPAGTQFARSLKMIGQRIKALIGQLDNRSYHQEAGVTVGVQLLDPHLLLSRAIVTLGRNADKVDVRIVSDRFDSLIQRLRSQEVDFVLAALTGADYGVNLVEEPICSEDFCVVACAGHPLACLSEVTAVQLRQYGWVLPQNGLRRQIALDHIFDDGRPPKGLVETHSFSAVRMILAESDKLTVLSRVEAMGELQTGLLKVLNFRVPGPGRTIGFIKRRDWKPDTAQQAFMEALRSAGRQLSQIGYDEFRDVHGKTGRGAVLPWRPMMRAGGNARLNGHPL